MQNTYNTQLAKLLATILTSVRALDDAALLYWVERPNKLGLALLEALQVPKFKRLTMLAERRRPSLAEAQSIDITSRFIAEVVLSIGSMRDLDRGNAQHWIENPHDLVDRLGVFLVPAMQEIETWCSLRLTNRVFINSEQDSFWGRIELEDGTRVNVDKPHWHQYTAEGWIGGMAPGLIPNGSEVEFVIVDIYNDFGFEGPPSSGRILHTAYSHGLRNVTMQEEMELAVHVTKMIREGNKGALPKNPLNVATLSLRDESGDEFYSSLMMVSGGNDYISLVADPGGLSNHRTSRILFARS